MWSALSVVNHINVTLLAKYESLALKLQYFHKMQNAVLILSQETKERLGEESLLRHANLSLSTSLSLTLLLFSLGFSLSFSLPLSLLPSQSLYPTQVVLLPLSFFQTEQLAIFAQDASVVEFTPMSA